MKNIKLLLSTLVIALIATSGVLAQDVTVDATAEVVANISFDDDQSVNFGLIDQELTPAPNLDASNGNATGVSGSSQFGFVLFSGTSGGDVLINITGGNSGSADQELLTGGSTTEDINYDIQVTETAGDATGGTPGGNTIVDGDIITLSDPSGSHTLWIGGQLNTPSVTPLPADTYTGTVQFSIDYTF